ncbi:hypothetical protein [Alkalibacterium sp. 20]|uniref:hypothetical protein n=1 Tax=Alkalibacterium sp. 20 TaxID=1798803 RepID=UPI0008FFFBE8|nr:hypothetical protein [Alkalibacterium sp. 20]OJF92170.1 hypothetical protein AX762_02920 [Alkalibacterium sp. 20]
MVENALESSDKKVDFRFVPDMIFTNPSIATVGLTEQQARNQVYDVKISIQPLENVPRVLEKRETSGVFKLVVDHQSGKILWAHVMAGNAGGVIYSATLAIQFGLTADDLKVLMAPYLTIAVGFKLAAITLDKDGSKVSRYAG